MGEKLLYRTHLRSEPRVEDVQEVALARHLQRRARVRRERGHRALGVGEFHARGGGDVADGDRETERFDRVLDRLADRLSDGLGLDDGPRRAREDAAGGVRGERVRRRRARRDRDAPGAPRRGRGERARRADAASEADDDRAVRARSRDRGARSRSERVSPRATLCFRFQLSLHDVYNASKPDNGGILTRANPLAPG